MGHKTAEVVQLPTRLVKEREAAELVRSWGVIRRDLQGSERAVALLEWGFSMEEYNEIYGLERALG